jgi:hypothetical protein
LVKRGPARGGSGSGRPRTGRNGAGRSGARCGDATPQHTRNRILDARRSAAKRPQLSNAGGDPRKSWPPGASHRDGEVGRPRPPAGRLKHRLQRVSAAHAPHRRAAASKSGLQVRRPAGSGDRTQSKGRGSVYAAPGGFSRPESRAFWLGGGSEGRRAQGQSVGDSVGEGQIANILHAMAKAHYRPAANDTFVSELERHAETVIGSSTRRTWPTRWGRM